MAWVTVIMAVLVLLLGGVPARATDGEPIENIGANYGSDWIDKVPKQAPARRKTPRLVVQRKGKWDLLPDVAPKQLSDKAVPMGLWLPMCFLFDPSVTAAKANEKLQAMTAAYAACGISLVPFSFPIGRVPADPDQVLALAKKACPIKQLFDVHGAVQVEASAELPQKMCHDPAANGCSTLCSPVSVSMVSANVTADVSLHESMHSNCCGPLCVDKGQGTGQSAGLGMELAARFERKGDDDDKVYASAETQTYAAPTISEDGCLALRAGAGPNQYSHWYDSERRTYYTADASSPRLDLMAGESFFPKAFAASIRPDLTERLELPTRLITAAPVSKTLEKLLATARIEQKPEEPRLDLPTSRLLTQALAQGSRPGRPFPNAIAAEPDPGKPLPLAARLGYSLGMAEEAVATGKGWKRRPPSQEIRIFDGFNASDLNKSSPQHFSE